MARHTRVLNGQQPANLAASGRRNDNRYIGLELAGNGCDHRRRNQNLRTSFP
jgi:hypothetical protein